MIHWAELQWATKQLFIVIYLMQSDFKDQIQADLLFQVGRGKLRQISGVLAAQEMGLRNRVLEA